MSAILVGLLGFGLTAWSGLLPVNAAPGDLDPGFDPDVNGTVYGTSVQPDGKILIGGLFSSIGGISRNRIARLHADGTVDQTFVPDVTNGAVNCIAVQSDGKIIIGGSFTTIGGLSRIRIARLHEDGTLDTSFDPGTGSNSDVYGVAIQPDGRILINGSFTSFNSQTRRYIARLNEDGSLDTSFDTGATGANSHIRSIAIQEDGKIVAGGNFATYNGNADHRQLVRLNSDGTVDASFTPSANANTVYSVALQPDGKILVAGGFDSISGVSRKRVARLNTDGTVDTGFVPPADTGAYIYSMALQADGRVLLGGSFTTVGGLTRNRIVRLEPDGSVDASFDPGTGASTTVESIAIQANGAILVGGSFTTFDGQSRNRFARLANGTPGRSISVPDSSQVQWLRSGAIPEVEQVNFELSIDGGANWSPLGDGTRITGGWECTGLSLPASGVIRARGRTNGGRYTGSSGIIEMIQAFPDGPEIVVDDPDGTDLPDGGSVDFGIVAVGDTSTRTLTIRNIGNQDLTGLGFTIDGPDAELFTVTTPPAAPVAGPFGSTTLTIQFSPASPGSRAATLHIASNDTDEASFDIDLSGIDTTLDAALYDLTLGAGALSPEFDPAVTNYTGVVPTEANTITFTPTAQSVATVTINGVAVPFGQTSIPFDLNVGDNIFTILVTAGDGVTTETYTVTISRPPGSVDSDFDPVVIGGLIRASAVQPDTKIILAGSFTSVGGQDRNKIARINADGTLDTSFDPGADSEDSINSVAIQRDGRILVTGRFQLNAVPNRLIRMNADGSLDPSFSAVGVLTASVQSLAMQPDGRILVAEVYTGSSAKITRLNADGTADTSFVLTTSPNGSVYSLAVQPDGKILIAGDFTSVGGYTRNRVARLNANGSLDTSFDPGDGANESVESMVLQPDGKIIIGGRFTAVGGQSRVRIARLESNGAMDSGFDPGTGFDGGISPSVISIVLQADGKLLAVGRFTSFDGQPRDGIARLNGDSSLDPTFNPAANLIGGELGVTLLADGEILVTGATAARFINDLSMREISVPSSATVQWFRDGSIPEVEEVTFELSTDDRISWTDLGVGTRIAGGWERNGLGLPAAGVIRARGRTVGGYNNRSSGIVELVQAFPDGPEIVVEHPDESNLTDGDTVGFGAVSVGQNRALTFTIKNIGSQDLTGLDVTVDGPDASMFTVTSQPATPVSGPLGSTAFTVEFAPSSPGLRTAALHIASNDADEDPFDLTLIGKDTTVDADLSDLVLSESTLTPVFDRDVTTYTARFPSDVSSVSLTPSTVQPGATLTINGVTETSGVAAGPYPLGIGDTIFDVEVTASNGVTTKLYSLTVTRPAGGIDLGFVAETEGTTLPVWCSAVQPDGRILFGGTFQKFNGQTRNGLARVFPDGTLDPTFDPGPGVTSTTSFNYVLCTAVQPDGKILVGGRFDSFNGHTRYNLARLHSDGSVDTSFVADTSLREQSHRVHSITLLPDGKMIVSGSFYIINGQSQQYLARLLSDGSLDTSFAPSVNNTVNCVSIAPDGKLLIGGRFSAVNGQARNKIARLNSDGTLDENFNPGGGIDGDINCILPQASGDILIAGNFTTVAGQPRGYFAALHSNGNLNTSFGANGGANNGVSSLTSQANGKILMGGSFTSVDGVAAKRIVRLNSDGSVDETFDSGSVFDPGPVTGKVYSVMLQPDGGVIVAGQFLDPIETLSGRNIARLENDSAAEGLTVSAARVEWTRSGSAPDFETVTFELSIDGGETWNPLGAGSRFAGGWERAGLTLPPAGAIRARGFARGGYRSGSSGLIEFVQAFPNGPEILVEEPVATNLSDGGARDFGTVPIGSSSSLTFTINNIGTEDLTGLGLTIDGPDADHFTVTASPSAPVSGPLGSTTFTVQFAPSAIGVKTAALHIASNDSDENPFDIVLTGTTESVDPTFNPDVSGTGVYATALQPDGKLLIAGDFTHVGGAPRGNIARLNQDGTIESTATFNPGAGTNGIVNSLAVQHDGQILLAGTFTDVGGEVRNGIARLNPDGTVESPTSFNPGTGADGPVYDAALQEDGKILLVGDFAQVNGLPRNRIARLHPDGTVEDTSTFNPGAGADAVIKSVAVQPDGMILIAGDFLNVQGAARTRVARLHPDGALELLATFDPGTGADDEVHSIALQADGRILLGGAFTSINGLTRNRIARLEPNGTVESTITFNPGAGADAAVHSIAVDTSGRVLLGGAFASVNGIARNRFARFGTDAASQTLSVPSSGLAQWIRDGAAPEVEQVIFELSTDLGATWSLVGGATRVPGGWENSALSLPTSGILRARARTLGGSMNASTGLIEQFQSFSNEPVALTAVPSLVTGTTAVLNGTLLPNGASMVWFEHGPTAAYGSTTPVQNIAGATTVDVEALVTGLTGNAPYHYRIVASNGAGTVHGQDVEFMTAPDPAIVTTGTPNPITTTSATLVGSVNPNGRETSIWFAYGPTELYGSTTPVQVIPAGTSVVDVEAPLSGLTPGSTYHYRLFATNTGGDSEGEDVEFVTNFPVPEATTGAASILTTTSVRVNGTVRSFGTRTEVFFDYGTDGVNFPNSVSANPFEVTDDGVTAVTAEIGSLHQGVTYYYRIRAVSSGGTGTGSPAPMALEILSGLNQRFPDTPPEFEGYATVNLLPDGILHGWRFLGEQEWRFSSVQARGLTTGNYTIEFRPVPGYIHPPSEIVEIFSGAPPTVLDRSYFEADVSATGAISVTLKPETVNNGPDPAQWRFLGEDDDAWRDSADTVSDLPAGAYLLEFKAVAGRTTPANANVLVTEGDTTTATVTYFLTGTGSGIEPVPLAFPTVATDDTKPYAWVGQIRTNVGLSSGFAVRERVVATAAHVVFDESTLTAVEEIQWLSRRHRDTYEPEPKIPRGYYILDGYGAQRASEGTPGEFSPQSRNRDVAVLYFHGQDPDEAAAAGRGYSGFLASDLDDNEFLLSDEDKLLVGYPVDGVADLVRGTMHATSPANLGFVSVGPSANRTFLSSDFRSTGGASGGPICVHYQGSFYPAAIYLGGTSQSVVRAIDSEVVDLFDRARDSGVDGNPHTSGGITHTNTRAISGSSSDVAEIQVVLKPDDVAGLGGWRLKSSDNSAPYRQSGQVEANLRPSRYKLEIREVSGYKIPRVETIRLKKGKRTTVVYTYAEQEDPRAGISLSGEGRSIGDGDATPSVLDGTDFGEAEVGVNTTSREFTISNPGTAPLTVELVNLIGVNPGDFSILASPGGVVAPGDFLSFEVEFDPEADGIRTAQVEIVHNAGPDPYVFAIQGNDSTDTDGNGFSDVEEAGLQELLRLFLIGEALDLDLSFLRVSGAQDIEIANLPPGLAYDSGTGRITGTPTGPAGAIPEIRKVDGMTIDAMLAFPMDVREPPRMLLSKIGNFGKVRVRKKSPARSVVITNGGGVPLTGLRLLRSGKGAKDFIISQPGVSQLDVGGDTSFRITFRPRKRGKSKAYATVFSNETARRVKLVGKGK